MRQSQGPFGEEQPIETESKRLTPSIGLAHDSEQPSDSSNEDFLFHLYRGSELLQDNRVHEAKEELERALHLQPRDTKGQDLLAVVYFRLGLYPRAIQIYEQLRRRNTGDTALLLNLALCYLKTGQPQLARRDLEHLLGLNSNHSRAWGYLGLACERLGDLAQAERAFREGGHTQMANRIAARRDVSGDPPPPHVDESQPSREVRDVANAAYQELDAGELSFALADPTRESSRDVASADAVGQSWRPVELGRETTATTTTTTTTTAQETRKPDTKDGLRAVADPREMTPSIPQLGHSPQSLNRRPTLIAPVGAPPAYEGGIASEYAAVERIPSHAPTSFTLDDAGAIAPNASPPLTTSPSVRRPVVAVPNPFAPPKSHDAPAVDEMRRRTLPPPMSSPASAPPPAAPLPSTPPAAQGPNTPLGIGPAPGASIAGGRTPPDPSRAPVARPITARAAVAPDDHGEAVSASGAVRFPETGGAIIHHSGVALVRTTSELGFAARLESFRVQQTGLRMQLLERHMKGKPTGESFGGVASPMVMATGDGHLVLSPRPGRKLTGFAIDGEMCFAREDILLGFGGGIVFENGRLTTGEGEFVPVVQLRGDGAVLLEAIGEVLTLPVHASLSLSVRREAILGWFGRLVPRAIAPSDAPCGQRGLVSFAGEGRVLVSSV